MHIYQLWSVEYVAMYITIYKNVAFNTFKN